MDDLVFSFRRMTGSTIASNRSNRSCIRVSCSAISLTPVWFFSRRGATDCESFALLSKSTPCACRSFCRCISYSLTSFIARRNVLGLWCARNALAASEIFCLKYVRQVLSNSSPLICGNARSATLSIRIPIARQSSSASCLRQINSSIVRLLGRMTLLSTEKKRSTVLSP